MDPAFTGSEIQPGTDIITQMGLDVQAFLVSYRSTYNAIGPIAQLENDIQAWLDINQPGTTIADVEYRAEKLDDFMCLRQMAAGRSRFLP